MKGDTISRSAAVKQILEEAAFIIRHDNGEDYKTGIGAGFKKAADMLENAPTVDAAPVVHGRWIPSKKHKWILDENGEIDMFAYSEDIHNGPECEICGESFCEHCEKDWATTECREPHYECSECGTIEKSNSHAYCHCGARMDAEEGAGE